MRFGSNRDHFEEDGLMQSTRNGSTPAQSYTMDEMQYMVRTSRTIPEELKEMVTLQIAQRAPLDAMWKNKQVYFQKGVFGGKEWAIRKDDFRLIEIITGTAIAVATFATVVGASPGVFAVTLVFAAVTLADRLRRKGASLNDRQYQIIVALKAIGPTSEAKLAEAASGLHIFGQDVWTAEKMAAALNDLKSVHLADGSTEALVAQAADGSWAVNGI